MNPARRSCRGGVRREGLPWWSAEALHPGSCSFSGHRDIFEKLRIRGHDDERLRIGVSNRAESCDAELPIGRSTIQLRVEQRSDEQTSKGPDADGGGNLKLTVLPQPFRTLLHCGMNYLFPIGGGARVHDWVSVCLSSEIPSEMVTREEFKFFIKDLVCKGEAFGMDFYPRPRCSLWPRIFGPPNMSMFQLENVLVLAELAALLRFLEINGKMVQLVLIVLPYWAEDNGSSPAFILSQDRTLLHSLHDSLMDIRIFCEEHGVICLECFSHEVRMRSHEYMDFTAWKIKKQAVYLDSIKKTGGDSKAAGWRKEIDENGHHVDSGKEIGGDGGSKELWLDVHASGSPNVSDDETQEDDSSDKEQGGDGGSEHEFSTHSDGFPGSVDEAESEDELSTDSDGEAESEDELPTNSDGGFHGSVDEMESIGRSVLQVNEIGNVESWAYISFSMSEKETIKFLEKLVGTCIDMGMRFHPMATSCVHVKPGSSTDVEDALWHMHDTISGIFSVHGREIGLLLVILPDKKVGDETYGIEIN